MNLFEVGDLVQVGRQEGSRPWTLCDRTNHESKTLEECLSYEDVRDDFSMLIYKCFYEKIGLIKKVINNKLAQPLLYEIEFPEGTYFCKAILASKYLRKV